MRLVLAVVTVVTLFLPALAAAQVRPANVEVDMVEFAFRPTIIRLEAGRLTRVVLRNRGQIAHQIQTDYLHGVAVRLVTSTLDAEVSGLDVIRLEPGASARLEFLPRQRGRFAFACTIEGHREVGMQGVLEVR